ncbi:uncharacterized protein BO95DRAFT_442101 [Aspergillus brunneoviolaceus CBS 621.78]|uniref:Uncharacterized protein n=1 Tax=Aspergillus brunneoviolaceus CBS 621.78 TaxID=1450534 RepID=A0ACD1GBE6_9EURO|nr:hypothetical protein BO95DRAFT_442101 [Aspergillus brunneoviolaceus CBS 621.78]RAH46583.1 hypothetical protein BO95DRAFT_442101 [Aspergillus brunneoviolaceus CBS 621.78]
MPQGAVSAVNLTCSLEAVCVGLHAFLSGLCSLSNPSIIFHQFASSRVRAVLRPQIFNGRNNSHHTIGSYVTPHPHYAAPGKV